MIKTIYASLLTASCCFFLRTGVAGDERRTEATSTYLTFPANESTSVNINSTCVAKSVASATKYTFQFSLPSDFSSDVLTFISETSSVLVTGLKYSTTYYARVKSNLSGYSTVTSFTTKSAAQYTFVSKPANGSVGNDAVELKVTANFVTGASRYTIELSKVSDFSDSTLVQTSTQDNQRTLIFHGLKYATKYYARVKTNLSDEYGKVTSFTTRAEQFASVKEPADNASEQDYSVIKVELVPVYQAKRYVVELSTQSDFSNALRLASLTDRQNVFVYENLLPSTTYYTRAISNVSTAYGSVTKFTTHAASAKRRLWGVTTGGGTAGAGTIFSFSLDSLTFTKHHDNVSTEYLHGSLTQGPGGYLYGMGIQYSTGDGGEVYRLSEQGNYSVLYNNGGIHFGSLMLASDNHLYVVDDWLNAFRGGIRRLSTDGSDQDILASIIQKFRSDTDGLNPIAAPIEVGEYLVGMAPHGGLNKKGVIYKRKFDGGFEVIHHFNGTDGASPQGRLTAGGDGYLYGMTFAGGASNQGTVFRIKPDGSNFKKLLDFSGANGRYPFGDLVKVGNFFYGMTSEGGNADDGIIFKIGSDGSFSKIFDFTGSNGAIPMGNLTLNNGILYGMTANGGTNDLGVIFKISTNGSGYTKLYDFTTAGGGNPDGSALIIDDTFDNSAARIASAVSNQIKPSFYPNPFSTSMTVEIGAAENENFSVTLTDLSGRVVDHQQGNHSMQIGDNLQQGTYIMKIVRGHEVIQQRVVKR